MPVLKTYAAAADFLLDMRAYLAAREVVNSLLLGLALRLVDNPLLYGAPPYFAAVMDDAPSGQPVLAALMTPPHNLVLAAHAEDVAQALELVARDLLLGGWPVPGTLGPVQLAQLFAQTWVGLTGATSSVKTYERVYELRQVVHPTYSPGALRPAAQTDVELVLAWVRTFHEEAMGGQPALAQEITRQRIVNGEYYLWDDGRPISMALRTRPTEHGVTIGAVYTPPELRGRGYASSCVAALSQRLLAAGFEYCTLFTDLSNPTSNSIYQKIGYRPVCDFQEISLISRKSA